MVDEIRVVCDRTAAHRGHKDFEVARFVRWDGEDFWRERVRETPVHDPRSLDGASLTLDVTVSGGAARIALGDATDAGGERYYTLNEQTQRFEIYCVQCLTNEKFGDHHRENVPRQRMNELLTSQHAKGIRRLTTQSLRKLVSAG